MEDKKKSINFTIVPDEREEVPRVYSNFCSIQNSPFDFTLTFCEMQPVSPVPASRMSRVKSRGMLTKSPETLGGITVAPMIMGIPV